MKKPIGTFDFNLDSIGPYEPGSPVVTIALQTWSKDNSGRPLISPHLMTESEIDFYVEALRADLAAVALQAKAGLRSKRKREQAL
jgi:hypothetical protein